MEKTQKIQNGIKVNQQIIVLYWYVQPEPIRVQSSYNAENM